MSEPTVEEVVSIVSSTFEVKAIGRTVDLIQFKIEDDNVKSKFVELAQKLEARDLICKLESTTKGWNSIHWNSWNKVRPSRL